MLRRSIHRVLLIVGIQMIFLAFAVLGAAAPQHQAACPGFETRLEVGIEARVMPGTPNNIRAQANVDATRVGQIPAGAVFTVLDGPQCNGGITWWYVNYNGVTGWTAEAAGSEQFLEPMPPLGTGGAGSGTGGNTSGDGRLLPEDIVSGLAFSGMGGGGGDVAPTHICRAEFVRYLEANLSAEYDTTISRGVGAVALGFETYRVVGEFENLPINVYSDGDLISDVDMLDPSQLTTKFNFAPAICIVGDAASDGAASSVSAVAPDGTAYSPIVQRLDGVDQVQLPIEAYYTPGIWTLEANDFSVRINTVLNPVTRGATQWRDTGAGGVLFYVVFGGYQPNEDIVFATELGDVVRVRTNQRGYAGYAFPNDGGYRLTLTAIVPSSGRNVYSEPLSVPQRARPDYNIPASVMREVLYNLTYQRGTFDPFSWTCPGSDAPSLRIFGYARVVTDTVNVRRDPNTNSPVEARLTTGDRVQVSEGVECSDGMTWWSVYGTVGGQFFSGWASQGDAREDFFVFDGMS